MLFHWRRQTMKRAVHKCAFTKRGIVNRSRVVMYSSMSSHLSKPIFVYKVHELNKALNW